jgi:hypothetical protein
MMIDMNCQNIEFALHYKQDTAHRQNMIRLHRQTLLQNIRQNMSSHKLRRYNHLNYLYSYKQQHQYKQKSVGQRKS